MKIPTSAALFCVALLLAASPAFALPVVTVDEAGNGTFYNGINTNPLSSGVGLDIGPGGLPNALLYDLLPIVNAVPGDVIIQEIGGGTSDIVRFNPGHQMVFYSDLGEANPPWLADTGFPTAFYGNQVIMVEPDTEIVVYSPMPGMPGYDEGFPNVTYTIISPEPATLSLLVLGGLAVMRRRR